MEEKDRVVKMPYGALEKRLRKVIRTRYARKFKAICERYFECVKIGLYSARVSRNAWIEDRMSFEELAETPEYKELINKLKKLNKKVTRTCNALNKVGLEIYITCINDIVFDL